MSDNDPDYPAMLLAAYMFGGPITSHVSDRIRNREGLRTAACDCCTALGRANWPAEHFAKSGTDPVDSQSSVC